MTGIEDGRMFLDIPGEMLRPWKGPMLQMGTFICLDDEDTYRQVVGVYITTERAGMDPVWPARIRFRLSETRAEGPVRVAKT